MSEQFEQILDEAIELYKKGKTIPEISAIFPEYKKDLSEILPLASELYANLEDKKNAFRTTLATLPGASSSKHMVLIKTIKYSLFSFAKLGFAAAFVLIIYAGINSKGDKMSTDYVESISNNSQNYATETGLSDGNAGSAYTNSNKERANKVVDEIRNVLNDFAPTNPIDTREYLKTYYQATIKTRHTVDLSDKIKTIIRGHGGRVDYSNINERSGSITFTLPKKYYEQFKNELKGLTYNFLFTERINETNLVEQKSSIEYQAAKVDNELTRLMSEKEKLVQKHNLRVNYLNRQIWDKNQEIKDLKNLINDPYANADQINSQIKIAEQKLTSLQNQLAAENRSYTTSYNQFDYSIRKYNNQMDNLQEQNTALLTNVETVQGTINLQAIGVLGILLLLTPYNWIVALILVAGLVYWNYKKANREISTNA